MEKVMKVCAECNENRHDAKWPRCYPCSQKKKTSEDLRSFPPKTETPRDSGMRRMSSLKNASQIIACLMEAGVDPVTQPEKLAPLVEITKSVAADFDKWIQETQ